MAKGKVKKEVEKYEKKAEDHKEQDKPKKRQPNSWAKFAGERYRQMKAKDPSLQFRDVLKDPATKQAYAQSKK